MRKLFQRDKKAPKDAPPPPGAPPPQQDEHWVVLSPSATPPPNGPTPEFSPLPPGAAPLQTQMQTGAGTPQQSPRPGTGTGGARPGQHMHHASHTTDSHHGHGHGHLGARGGGGGGGGGQQGLESVSVHSDSPLPPNAKDGGGAGNKLQKKTGFFSRNRDNGPQHQQHQQQQQHEHHPTGQPGELTRMIGYLTGFASDDWTIVLEVCERAAANDANAKEAAKALRREFKYAEPSAQMAAARLWAIMLRYSSDIFIAQTTTKKFLDVVEDVCTSSKTTPVVRERLLEVLAGAAYAHPSPGREGFAGAWRRVKSPGQPDEGIPFDDLDPMFTPPAPKRQQQHTPQPQQSPYGTERNPFETRRRHRSDRTERTQQQQQQVPSAEEDMRRLFEECSLASQHAQLLSQAMTYAKPSELAVNSVIREFHQKCMASQDFIVAQIPWATANAERSREKLQEQQAVAAVAAGNLNGPTAAQQQLGNVNAQAPVHAETGEEQLLAALLLANQELIEAFRQYDELDRLGMQEAEEREVEARSRVETKIDRTQIQYWSADGSFQLDAPQQGHSGGPSRSPSPSSFNPSSHHNHSSSNLGGGGGGAGRPALPHSNSFSSSQGYGGGGPQIHAQPPTPVDKAMPPPPPAPMGPRRPRSRTPSPTRGAERERDRERDREAEGRKRASVQSLMASEAADVRERERDGPPAPSQKALGKRRAVEPELDTHELYRQQHALDETTEESEDESSGRPKRVKAPVHYVYDAAAERSRERLAAQAAAKAAAASKPAPSAKAPNAKSAAAPMPPPASTRPQPKVSPVQTAAGDKGKEAGGGKGSLRGSPLDNREPKRPPAPARSPSQTTPTGKALPRPAVPPVNGNARP